MAWSTPRTWTAGEVVTAAIMNTHVRDQLDAIALLLPVASGTLTDGGVLVGNGTGTIQALAVLADGRIHVGDGTTDPAVLHLLTSSTGTVRHEAGGIEADISAIAKGGVLLGTGAGTMGITTVGTDDQFFVADSSAGGGVSWQTKAVPAGNAQGSYTGNGGGARTISTGFLCKMAIVIRDDGTTGVQAFAIMVFTSRAFVVTEGTNGAQSNDANFGLHATNGFTVGSGMNTSAISYRYYAIG